MKTFNFALDLSHVPEEERKTLNPKTVFEKFFFVAINSANPGGVGIEQHRKVDKILSKIDKAQGVDFVELEDAEFEFLADSFRRGKFHPSAYKIALQISSAIEVASK